jgi:hypothetical protein
VLSMMGGGGMCEPVWSRIRAGGGTAMALAIIIFSELKKKMLDKKKKLDMKKKLDIKKKVRYEKN